MVDALKALAVVATRVEPEAGRAAEVEVQNEVSVKMAEPHPLRVLVTFQEVHRGHGQTLDRVHIHAMAVSPQTA